MEPQVAITPPTVVLNLDDSVGAVPGRLDIELGDWQEAIRFGCRVGTFRRFRQAFEPQLPPHYGTVMTGSGDFHHLTWALVARLPTRPRFQVVVLDNHPDNMRYPLGVHCGSWVRRVAALPQVAHVHVLGICSTDIGLGHAWENYLAPLLRGKLTYWSMGVDLTWAHRIGLGRAFRSFADPDTLVAAFADTWASAPSPVYLSIDKDVFAPDVAPTNWDQGRFAVRHALDIIRILSDSPWVGSDINGEISFYRYASWLKRRLSALDQQPAIDPAKLDAWQQQQHAVNLHLLQAIQCGAARAAP